MVEVTCIGSLWKAYKAIIKRWLRGRKKKQRVSSPSKKNCNQSNNNNQLHHKEHFDKAKKGGGSWNGRNDKSNGPSRRSLRRSCSSVDSRGHRYSRSTESIHAPLGWSKSAKLQTPQLSRSASGRKSFSCTIMYSSSSGMLKPQPIEMIVECTLEQLFHGCKKKFKITRDVINYTGAICQKEETVTLDVEPGWRTGTKVTFENFGNDRTDVGQDIIFSIWEKKHQLFRREGDDLELVVEIPLVKALSGCTIPVPLLGGEEMNLNFEQEIIYPGFEKVISGQGMPIFSDDNKDKRGDLRIKFLVEFPTYLTDQQRAEVVSILKE
ncbi:hypothetical protein PIB30_004682 [Stylosanthes scabra]|uniref:Chaperone DnaJ C-terminal domain-containing protein n=1 Tax=Stylosanthes scabra TaxID=79078 RepID=A0ABU6R414_9FABA|nr:hypothetical protein [Stylosanthes scabra]